MLRSSTAKTQSKIFPVVIGRIQRLGEGEIFHHEEHKGYKDLNLMSYCLCFGKFIAT